jgi:ADP-ribose pyrophosphatase YjhB (NUDIX family)
MNAPESPAHLANAGMGRLPRITVATVVSDGERFLFVEERVHGMLVVNQPAGHLEADETLTAAAARETLEETGWQIEITGLVAVYHWPNPPDRKPVLRFTFAGRALSHDPARELDTGITRALWLTADELTDGSYRLRSPLVARSVDDFLAGQCAPLSLLASIGITTVPTA